MAELTYREAVARGIAQEMTRDPDVIFFGEDVGKAGGVFKSTVGLYDQFGPRRVKDCPISEQAILGAAMGAAMTGLKPIAAEARDLFRRPFASDELKAFDAAVFDPPRQGAEAQARQLAASRVPLIVAVSCNAATFARDAKTLSEGGWRLDWIRPVGQFRWSTHVELVAAFRRQRNLCAHRALDRQGGHMGDGDDA